MSTSHPRPGKWIAAAAAIASVVALSGAGALGANATRPARVTEYPLRVIAFHTVPARPKAGKPFLALAAILNEETAEPVSGTVRCPARIGAHAIRVRFKDLDTGVAGCGWAMSRASGGKRLVASIEVTSDEGYEVSIPFSKRIRP